MPGFSGKLDSSAEKASRPLAAVPTPIGNRSRLVLRITGELSCVEGFLLFPFFAEAFFTRKLRGPQGTRRERKGEHVRVLQEY